MYLPGSYLVYPTPIHLHPSFPPPGVQPPGSQPPGAQPVRSPPAGPSPPSVSSRDLKFGVERILSGDVYSRSPSRPLHPPPPPGGEGRRRGSSSPGASDAAPGSPEARSEDSSLQSGETLGSPGGPFRPSPPPAPLPALAAQSRVLLSGEPPYHPFHAPPFSSPPSSPFPRALASDPLGPSAAPAPHRAPPPSPYAAAYAAAAGFYLHHQHHPAAMLPYAPPLFPQHLEDAPVAAGPVGGATCIPVTSTGGGGVGGGVASSAAGGGKRKRSWSRAVFSNLQRKGLEKRFQLQKYITKPDRRQLAATLGLTDAQVKVWFQNRRMKWRHSKEGKQQIVEAPAPSLGSSMPPPPTSSAPSLHLLGTHEEEKSNHSPSTILEPMSFSPEWESQESRSTDRPDSTQKGLEEEIQVDS